MANIGIIIPDRNDRPVFTANCYRQLKAVLPFVSLAHVNGPPQANVIDITRRYKFGYNILRNQGIDLIFCIENDEWYCADYFNVIIEAWKANGRPDLFGIDYTYYYHIKLKRYFKYEHTGRSSMMCTVIKPDLDIAWPKDNYPFTDMHLWRFMQNKKTFRPDEPIAISMKGHGVGMTGGTGHTDRLGRYVHQDEGFGFLRGHLDNESFEFFSKL